MTKKVGVLGGGISGLAFASLVKNAEVLERENKVGGLARSIKEAGYTFDLGSHIIFSKNEQVLRWMLELLKDNRIKHRRNTKILYKGRYVKYPFENGLGDLPGEETLECVLDYVEALHRGKKGVTFKEWMYNRFGNAISNKYLYPYNAKIWDYPPEKMSDFWVEGRVPQPPLRDVMKAVMGMESEGYTHQLNFYYPKNDGYQAVTDALARQIGKERIKSNFDIQEIRKDCDAWIVKGSKGQNVRYDKLVSTIHIKDLLHLYDQTPKKVLDAAKALRWNSIYLVMLGIKKEKLNDMHWCYIPEKELLPNRISFPSNYSPNVAPAGHSSVLAEVTFDPNGKKAKMKGEEVVERTISDLNAAGVLDANQVAFRKLVTCRYAYVVYDLEYEKNIKTVREFASEDGITLLGRFSEFSYMNADKCIESAMEKARLFCD
jgi:protoporphyrinogen oxidase